MLICCITDTIMVREQEYGLLTSYSMLPAIQYRTIFDFSSNQERVQRKFTICTELLQKQSWIACVFTLHMVVLPSTTSSTGHWPPSCRCHYSTGQMNLWCIIEHVSKIFYPPISTLRRKILMQELKLKNVFLILHLISVRVFSLVIGKFM
jgi:hypothetical protein